MFSTLISTLLLQSHVDFGGNQIIGMTKTVLDAIKGPMGTLTNVGIGIASVFLLVVVFVYISQILDGGKFQVKMLIPLLIYVCVCHFSLVAVPVVNFASAIQRGCRDACIGAKNNTLNQLSGGKDVGIFRAFWEAAGNATADDPVSDDMAGISGGENGQAATPENFESLEGDDALGSSPELRDEKEKRGMIQKIGAWFSDFGKSLTDWYNNNIKIPFYDAIGLGGRYLSYGLMGIIGQLLDICCVIIEFAVSAMGAVMMGIVIAFGPITWAFAVWPNNHKTIGAWAIRICQFALYSPICCLISAFFMAIIRKFAEVGASTVNQLGGADAATSSVLCIIGLLLGLAAAMMSVPAIASMIIEGAQGSVSLSQGLQTAIGMYSNMTMIGERMRDKQQLQAANQQSAQLNAIGKALGADMSAFESSGNTGGSH